MTAKGRIVAALVALLGAGVGVVAGFWAGMMGWCYGYYLIAMRPKGTPFRAIDQAAIPGLFTGLIGAVVGGAALAVLSGWLARRALVPPTRPHGDDTASALDAGPTTPDER